MPDARTCWEWSFCVLLLAQAYVTLRDPKAELGSVEVAVNADDLDAALGAANGQLANSEYRDPCVRIIYPFGSFVGDDLASIRCDACKNCVLRMANESAADLIARMQTICECINKEEA